MRLLNSKLEFRDFDNSPPPYAILSHTWSKTSEDEVTFQDLKSGTAKSLLKLELCREWAKAANLEYFWIDTCCIDKRNDAEISYAIRSMWRWYCEAKVCFVYLSDLSKKRKEPGTDWRDRLKVCRWFKRGWTLQELVAPKEVEFYASDGYLGSKKVLLPALKSITGINLGEKLPDHVTRLSWAAKRVTKRPEDKAYCMLGICDVSIDPRYGEGRDLAWQRLQEAITHRHGTIALQVHGAANNPDHRETVLEALRFNALETRRKTVQLPLAQTCKWILNHPACAKWLNLEHKFFWIKGKPGSGKSVLIKYLDQHVTWRLKKSKAIGLYFYFNARGEQLERSFMGLYRLLLVHLVDLVPELAHELDELDTEFDLAQLKRVLASAIRGLNRQIWLFIDALDECREGDVRELIQFLERLQEAELRVCLASRHYPMVKVPTNLQLLLEEVDEHQQDLSTYVEQLDLQGEELAQMQHDIVAKFHAMQSRLREIPQGLPELFKTIILRDDEHKDEFLLCLRWILYAKRPLTLKEWYYAMMAGVGGPLESDERTTDDRMETFLLSSSKGLAELSKGKTVSVQFIHESVRDFLVDQEGFKEIYGAHESLESTAHDELKRHCLRGFALQLPRQLELRENKKQRLTKKERSSLKTRYPFAEYATTYVLHHADQAAAEICQQRFLTDEFNFSDWLALSNAFQKSKPKVYSVAPSLHYLCAERDLKRLISQPIDSLSLEPQQRYRTPLIAAIVYRSWDVLRVMLADMNSPNVEETIAEVRASRKLIFIQSLLSLPWAWAVTNGLHHLAESLSTSVSEDQISTLNGPCSDALRAASERGHSETVQFLLDKGANVNASGGEYGSALQAALRFGHREIAQLLLDRGADVKASGGEYGSALQAALRFGYREIAQLLLDRGADINASGS